MMLSQPFRAYLAEPKEAAPFLLIIRFVAPPLNAIKSALQLDNWVGRSGERLSAGRLVAHHLVDHAISLVSMAAFRRPPRKMKSA